MQIQLIQEEQKDIDNIRELNRLKTEVTNLVTENQLLSEELKAGKAQIAQLNVEAAEQLEKYQKVKKAHLTLKNQAMAEHVEYDRSGTQLVNLQLAHDGLQDEH